MKVNSYAIPLSESRPSGATHAVEVFPGAYREAGPMCAAYEPPEGAVNVAGQVVVNDGKLWLVVSWLELNDREKMRMQGGGLVR